MGSMEQNSRAKDDVLISVTESIVQHIITDFKGVVLSEEKFVTPLLAGNDLDKFGTARKNAVSKLRKNRNYVLKEYGKK